MAVSDIAGQHANKVRAAPSAHTVPKTGAQAGVGWPLETIKAALPTVSKAPSPPPLAPTSAPAPHLHPPVTLPPTCGPSTPPTPWPHRARRHLCPTRLGGRPHALWQHPPSARQRHRRRQQPLLAALQVDDVKRPSHLRRAVDARRCRLGAHIIHPRWRDSGAHVAARHPGQGHHARRRRAGRDRSSRPAARRWSWSEPKPTAAPMPSAAPPPAKTPAGGVLAGGGGGSGGRGGRRGCQGHRGAR